MKKKIIIACLVFLVVLVFSVFTVFYYGAGLPVIKEVKNFLNIQFKGNLKNGALKLQDSNIIFHKIQKDFEENKINKLEYSKATFYAAFFADKTQNKYKGHFPDRKIIDMRMYIQYLVNNYQQLDNEARKKLEQVIFPEKNTKKSKTSSILFPFIPTIAYAEAEETFFPESYEISENVWVNGFDGYFFKHNLDLIEDTVHDSQTAFEAMGFDRPSFRIDIIIEEHPAFMTSYSVFVKPGIFDNTQPVYRIYIDKNCTPEDLQAYIVHELFHAYQEQVLLPISFIPVDKDRLDFIKEATAIWAIDQVYPDNNYELEFAQCIYEDSKINYSSFDICQSYTWYQMFFYFTEIINSADHRYVRNVFEKYKDFENFDRTFDVIHIERSLFNSDFSDFGMALFGRGEYEGIFLRAEPQYPYLVINEEAIDVCSLKDAIKNSGDEWDEYVFEAPGYYYKIINIPEDFNGRLIIQQNLSMTEEKQMTGMRIGISKNDRLEWQKVGDEPAMVVVDIGGSIESIDSIVLMFFSSSFDERQRVQYKITSGEGQKAKGSIIFKLEKTFNPASGVSGKEGFTFVAGEELVKASFQTGNQRDDTLSHIIGGDKYLVRKFEADYIYQYLFKKDKEETKITGTGHYLFEDDKLKQSQDSSQSSGAPSLPGFSGKISDEIFSRAGKALKELEKIEGSLKGVDIPELPDLPEMKDLPDINNYPDMNKDISGDIFGTGEGRLPRIVIRPEVKVFEFMPSLPADIESKDWVEYESIYKIPDPDDPKKIKTETHNYKDKPTQLLPLWFCNPDYTENGGDATQEFEESQLDIKDIKQFTQKLISFNSKFNRFNIQKLIDNPEKLFERDFRQEIEPKPDYAVLKEKASFINNRFTAELKAKAITKNGNVVDISITAEYTFD